MKIIRSVLIVLAISTSNLYAENTSDTVIKTYYGVSFSMITSGTGHGVGYCINGSITKGRKSLEVGLIYNDRESKFTGGDFKYKIFLGKIDRFQSEKKVFTTYLQYNLILQKGTSYSPDIVKLGDVTYLVETDPGIITTIEHHLSFGNKIAVFRNTYLDASMGFGFYHGSIDKVVGPETFGIHFQNYGFTYSFKFGFGYSFK